MADSAPIKRVRVFLGAWDAHHKLRDPVLAQVEPCSADILTSHDLRALLAEVDQQRERAEAAEEKLSNQPVYVLNLDDSPLSPGKVEAIKRILRSDV